MSHLDGSGKRRHSWPPAETAPSSYHHANRAALHHDTSAPTRALAVIVSPCRTARSNEGCASRAYSRRPSHAACLALIVCSAPFLRICSKQGGSSQGDSLFWPSALKRNLTRPASDRSQQEMGVARAGPAAHWKTAPKEGQQRAREAIATLHPAVSGRACDDGIHLSAPRAGVFQVRERLPSLDVAHPGD